MEINIGRYKLKSDRFCAWIERETATKEGKNKGKVRNERVTGYYRDFGALLDDFMNIGVKDSDASSLKQVLAEIDSALKDAKKIAKAAVKEDFQIIRKAR